MLLAVFLFLPSFLYYLSPLLLVFLWLLSHHNHYIMMQSESPLQWQSINLGLLNLQQ